jgi:hypothetical protein
VTDASGNQTVTAVADGVTTTTYSGNDGTTATTVQNANGTSVSTVTLAQPSNEGENVLPIPAVQASTDRDTASTVTINVKTSENGTQMQIVIPVDSVTPGTVAILVQADGTEKIMRDTKQDTQGIGVTVSAGSTLRIVDNTKTYSDTVGHWGSDAIAAASARELFNGTSATTFSPNRTLSRSEIAQVLYNLEDNPQASTDSAFTDVHPSAWYAQAINWAAGQGILQGHPDGHFDTSSNITRQDLAVILYRYAQSKGAASVDRYDLDVTDEHEISEYAYEAVCWAYANGVMNGKPDGRFDPKGSATRAEAAQVMMNYLASRSG